MKERTWRGGQWTATAMAVVFFYSSVLAPPFLQAGFWEERRQAIQARQQSSGLVGGLAAPSTDLLAQLPPGAQAAPIPFDLTPTLPDGTPTSLDGLLASGFVPRPSGVGTPPFAIDQTGAGKGPFSDQSSGLGVGGPAARDSRAGPAAPALATPPRIIRQHLAAAPWLQHLPWEWVVLRDLHWPAKANTAGPVVIHLQDVHGHPEAQLNIGRALSSLLQPPSSSQSTTSHLDLPSPLAGEGQGEGVFHRTSLPLLVGIEGASGPFLLDPFRAVPQVRIRQHVSEALVREGLLSGPEYAGITAPVAPLLWGIEDEGFYLANVHAFKQALPLQAHANETLQALHRELTHLKKAHYSPLLQELDGQMKAYHGGKLAVGSYLRVLVEFSERTRLAPSGNPRTQFQTPLPPGVRGDGQYPNITAWLAVERLERNLNRSHAEQERQRLLRQLAERLSPQAVHRLIAASLDYRLGQLSIADYRAHLDTAMGRAGLSWQASPEFARYFDYLLLAGQIQIEQLWEELSASESVCLHALATTPQEQALVQLSHYLALAEKLIALTLTPHEWQTYYQLTTALNLPTLEHTLGIKVPGPQDWLTPFEAFYRYADQRNHALITNLLAKLEELGSDPNSVVVPAKAGTQRLDPRLRPSEMTISPRFAVLVTGGFHTPAIHAFLREHQVPYLTLAPRLTAVGSDHRARYLEAFFPDQTPLHRLFAGEKLSMNPPPALAASTARVGFPGRTEFTSENYASLIDIESQLAPLSPADRAQARTALLGLPSVEAITTEAIAPSLLKRAARTSTDAQEISQFTQRLIVQKLESSQPGESLRGNPLGQPSPEAMPPTSSRPGKPWRRLITFRVLAHKKDLKDRATLQRAQTTLTRGATAVSSTEVGDHLILRAAVPATPWHRARLLASRFIQPLATDLLSAPRQALSTYFALAPFHSLLAAVAILTIWVVSRYSPHMTVALARIADKAKTSLHRSSHALQRDQVDGQRPEESSLFLKSQPSDSVEQATPVIPSFYIQQQIDDLRRQIREIGESFTYQQWVSDWPQAGHPPVGPPSRKTLENLLDVASTIAKELQTNRVLPLQTRKNLLSQFRNAVQYHEALSSAKGAKKWLRTLDKIAQFVSQVRLSLHHEEVQAHQVPADLSGTPQAQPRASSLQGRPTPPLGGLEKAQAIWDEVFQGWSFRPWRFDLKPLLRKTCAPVLVLSFLFMFQGVVQAHHFLQDRGDLYVQMERWDPNFPAENTTGGATQNILKAMRKLGYPIPVGEGGRLTWKTIQEGIDKHILSANPDITDTNAIRSGQKIKIIDVPPEVANYLVKTKGVEAKPPPLEETALAKQQQLQTTIDALEQKLQGLRGKIQKGEADRQQLQQQIQALQEEIGKLARERDQLATEVDQLRKATAAEKQAIETAKAKLQDLQRQLEQLNQQIKKLEEKRALAIPPEKPPTWRDYLTKWPVFLLIGLGILTLGLGIGWAVFSKRQRRQLEQRERELQQQKEAFEQEKNQWDSTKTERDREVNELQAQKVSLEQEVNRLNNDLSNLTEALRATQAQVNELREMSRQAIEGAKAAEDAKAQAEEATQTALKVREEALREKAQIDETIKASRRIEQELTDNLNQLKRQLVDLEQQVPTVRRELETLIEKLNLAREDLKAIEDREREVSEQEQRLAQWERELEAKARQVVQAEVELERIKVEKEALEGSISKAQAELNQLAQELQALARQIEDEKAKYQQLTEDNQNIEQLKATVQTLLANLATLQTQLVDVRKQFIDTARAQLNRFADQFNRFQNTNDLRAFEVLAQELSQLITQLPRWVAEQMDKDLREAENAREQAEQRVKRQPEQVAVRLTQKEIEDLKVRLKRYLQIQEVSRTEDRIRRELIKDVEEIFSKGYAEVRLNPKERPRNLVMDIKVPGEAQGKPTVIAVCAHLDIDETTKEKGSIDVEERTTAEGKGALYGWGMDDKSGLAAIMAALRVLKEKNILPSSHLTIRLILTAEEEHGHIGAQYLAEHHCNLLEDIHLMFSIDGGRLGAELGDGNKVDLVAVNWRNIDQRGWEKAIIIESANKVYGRGPTEFTNSGGDELIFGGEKPLSRGKPIPIRIPIAHFRANYYYGKSTGKEPVERQVEIDDLVLLTEWLVNITADLADDLAKRKKESSPDSSRGRKGLQAVVGPVLVPILSGLLGLSMFANPARFAKDERGRVVATVEQGDTVAGIAGRAYEGMVENPQAQWPKVYRANRGPQAPYTRLGPVVTHRDLKMVRILPGDQLYVPEPVNPDSTGLVVAPTPPQPVVSPPGKEIVQVPLTWQDAIKAYWVSRPLWQKLGIIGLLITFVPLWLLGLITVVTWAKGKPLQRQNRLLKEAQTKLIEKNRRLAAEHTELVNLKKQAEDAYKQEQEALKQLKGQETRPPVVIVGPRPPQTPQDGVLLWNRVPKKHRATLAQRFGVTPDQMIQHITAATQASQTSQLIGRLLREHPSLADWMEEQPFYHSFKEEAQALGLHENVDEPFQEITFSVLGDQRRYALVLSDRGPEYLVRGWFSGDCTNCGPWFVNATFQTATLNHILAPGFFNFKVLRNREWVGNIYALAIQHGGQPILLVDAIQIPWRVQGGRGTPVGAALPGHERYDFPVLNLQEAERISDGALEGLRGHAKAVGYQALWLSVFVSNFYDLKAYYEARYGTKYAHRTITPEMIIGWRTQRQALGLSPSAYIESLNRPAWEGGEITRGSDQRVPRKGTLVVWPVEGWLTTASSWVGYLALAALLIYGAYRLVKWIHSKFRALQRLEDELRQLRQQQTQPREPQADDVATAVESPSVPTLGQGEPSQPGGGPMARAEPPDQPVSLSVPDFLTRTASTLSPALRGEMERRFYGLLQTLAQGSIQTWPRAFQEAMALGELNDLWELPLLVPLTVLRSLHLPKAQALEILRRLENWMNGVDARVINDLRRGIENAQWKVTEDLLSRLDTMSDEEFLQLLTQGPGRKLRDEIFANIRRFMDEIRRFYGPSPEERRLWVNPEIQARYERFPRYLKWLLSQHPELEHDREIQTSLQRLHARMMRIPGFASEITEFSRETFRQTLQLHPRLVYRILECLTKDIRRTPEVRTLLDQARQESSTAIPLPPASAPALPAPPAPSRPEGREAPPQDRQTTQEVLHQEQERLHQVTNELTRQQTRLQKAQADLTELLKNQQEAKAEGLKPLVETLEFSIKGYRESIAHLEKTIARLTVEKQRLQAEVEALKKRLGQHERGSSRLSVLGWLALAGISSLILAKVTDWSFPKVLLAAVVATSVLWWLRGLNMALWVSWQTPSLPFWRTMNESRPRGEGEPSDWARSVLINEDNAPRIGLALVVGWVLGGLLLWYAYGHWPMYKMFIYSFGGQHPNKNESSGLSIFLWIFSIVGMPFVAFGAMWWLLRGLQGMSELTRDLTRLGWWFLRFPRRYLSLMTVTQTPPSQLALRDIQIATPLLLRVSPQLLERALARFSPEDRQVFKQRVSRSPQDTAVLEGTIAWVQLKEDFSARYGRTAEERTALLQAIATVQTQLSQDHQLDPIALLTDILPKVAAIAPTTEKCLRCLDHLKAISSQSWRKGTDVVLGLLKDRVAFEQAKEEVANRLIQVGESKEQFLAALDNAANGLVPKGINSYGILKEVLPAILQYRHTTYDYLTCLNHLMALKGQVWQGGAQSVLKALRDLTTWYDAKRGYLQRFGNLPALAATYEQLERTIDMLDIDAINSFKLPLQRLAEASETASQFELWLNIFMKLDQQDVAPFLRDLETVLEVFRQEGAGRDWAGFPEALKAYRQAYGPLMGYTPTIIRELTDPAKSIPERVRGLQRLLHGQKLVMWGIPPHLTELDHEPVSAGELMRALSNAKNPVNPEHAVKNMVVKSHVKNAMAKMGRDGLYTYFETQQPRYYQDFKTEVKGLEPHFNRPGEKFRVVYDPSLVQRLRGKSKVADDVGMLTHLDSFEETLEPIQDAVKEVKEVLGEFKTKWPNSYRTFVEGKRKILKERSLEEAITEETYPHLVQRLFKHFKDQEMSLTEKVPLLVKLLELLSFPETKAIREQLRTVSETPDRHRLLVDYWSRVLGFIKEKSLIEDEEEKKKWLSPKAKVYPQVIRVLKVRVAKAHEALGKVGPGILQFFLSGKTPYDFFGGYVGEDCTAPGGLAEYTFPGTVLDPAFLFFKVMENNRWVGNMYAMVLKDSKGQLVFLLDNLPLHMEHPIAKGDAQLFAQQFFPELLRYVAEQGFAYLVVARDPSTRDHIRPALLAEARSRGAIGGTVTVQKPGGTGHFEDFGVSAEFLQAFKKPGEGTEAYSKSNIHAGKLTLYDGWKVAVPDTSQERRRRQQAERQRLQRELEEVGKQLQAVRTKQDQATDALKVHQDAHAKYLDKGERASAEAAAKGIETKTGERARLQAELERLEKQAQTLRKAIAEMEQSIESHKKGGPSDPRNPDRLGVILALQGWEGLDGEALVAFLLLLGFFAALIYLGHVLYQGFRAKETPRGSSPVQDPPQGLHAQRQYWSQPVHQISELDQIWNNLSDLAKRSLLALSPSLTKDHVLRTLQARILEGLHPMGVSDIQRLIDDISTKQTLIRQAPVRLPFQLGADAYELVLSPRDADDLVRGYLSADCTNCGSAGTFRHYLPKMLTSEGFFNFRVIRRSRPTETGSQDRWVGNVYAFAAQIPPLASGGDPIPILVIDAVQLPFGGLRGRQDGLEVANEMTGPLRFPFRDVEEAKAVGDAAMSALIAYVRQGGTFFPAKGSRRQPHPFGEVWHGFFSNFVPLAERYMHEYQSNDQWILRPGTSVHGDPVAFAQFHPWVPRHFTAGGLMERHYAYARDLVIEPVGVPREIVDSFTYQRGFARLWVRGEPRGRKRDEAGRPSDVLKELFGRRLGIHSGSAPRQEVAELLIALAPEVRTVPKEGGVQPVAPRVDPANDPVVQSLRGVMGLFGFGVGRGLTPIGGMLAEPAIRDRVLPYLNPEPLSGFHTGSERLIPHLLSVIPSHEGLTVGEALRIIGLSPASAPWEGTTRPVVQVLRFLSRAIAKTLDGTPTAAPASGKRGVTETAVLEAKERADRLKRQT